MKTIEELYAFIKSTHFYLKVISLVERDVGANFISIRRKRFGKNIKTVRDYVSRLESDKSQQTGKVTILLAPDFEEAVKEVLAEEGFNVVGEKLSKNGENRSDAGVMVLDKQGESVIHFEIKASQLDDGWQGATHGLNKVPRYLLFNFTVNMDYELPDANSANYYSLHGLITHAYCAFHDGKLKWKGKATKTNARTTANIPGSVSNKVHHIALGQIERMSQNKCRTPTEGKTLDQPWVRASAILHRQNLNSFRNKQNILV